MSGRNQLKEHQYYEILFNIRNSFNTIHQSNYSRTFDTNDPVLRNIAIYISEIYNDANARCNMSGNCPKLCDYVNKWLNEKQALYTMHGKCKLNTELWNRYIENLFTILSSSDISSKWCDRKPFQYKSHPSEESIPSSCNNDKSIDFSVSCVDTPGFEMFKAETPRCPPCYTSIASISIGYILFGIVIISVLLYKFIPMRSWSSELIRWKQKIRRYLNDQTTQELISDYENDVTASENRRFNIVYGT
ncbi:PIR Superfamily Protein [Plasmodium ovale wallikeri]|uniref:PIR Superfamily Protein n=2 Tax=Plasmodium ovale TaxID=36330 RepID=A0A1A8Z6Q3_PLAOA|nr:PIR Superfamily Protein [Plasmodium ovale wallikeri]SBT39998.1 PIR Superfamily Protein [Plasmodium ovale wallikeri]SBT74628.1 PIR protein [Plasmodium ovale]